LAFHSQLLRVVAAEAAAGDAASVLAAVDAFCLRRHWMMHVGPVKGDILRRAAAAAPPGGAWVELGAYCRGRRGNAAH